jgi:hypothetical protein
MAADPKSLLGLGDATLLDRYARLHGCTVSQAKQRLGVWAMDPGWRDRAKAAIMLAEATQQASRARSG